MSSPPWLACLAAVLRVEGDIETADGIDRQQDQTRRAQLTAGQQRQLETWRTAAGRLERRNRYRQAAVVYGLGLGIVERVLGPATLDTCEWLHDRARCRLNDGDHERAIDDLVRLSRLLDKLYGDGDAVLEIAREQPNSCRQARREGIATQWLEATVARMTRAGLAGEQGVPELAWLSNLRDRPVRPDRQAASSDLLAPSASAPDLRDRRA